MKKGSSGNSGKRSADFQEKIGVITKAICDPLEDFDLVVDAFEDPGVQAIAAMTENAIEMPLENRHDLAQRRNATRQRAPPPRAPEASGGGGVVVVPQMFEIVLQHVDDKQRAIGVE